MNRKQKSPMRWFTAAAAAAQRAASLFSSDARAPEFRNARFAKDLRAKRARALSQTFSRGPGNKNFPDYFFHGGSSLSLSLSLKYERIYCWRGERRKKARVAFVYARVVYDVYIYTCTLAQWAKIFTCRDYWTTSAQDVMEGSRFCCEWWGCI